LKICSRWSSAIRLLSGNGIGCSAWAVPRGRMLSTTYVLEVLKKTIVSNFRNLCIR
jgi:hypothetical protein